MVFQDDNTFPWLTVLKNNAFGLKMNGVDHNERRKRARDMVELSDLTASKTPIHPHSPAA